MELLYPINPGILEVYYGPMRSGKSGKVIERVASIEYVPGAKYVAFKPLGDTRTPGKIYSRMGGGISIPAIEIPDEMPEKALGYISKDISVVLFDEAEFFSEEITDVVEKLLDDDKNVIISGPNLNFRGEPFGMVPYFIARADIPVPLYALCEYSEKDSKGNILSICGKRATRTQRLLNGQPAPYNDILKRIGDKEGVDDASVCYEPRCRKHHIVPGRPY